LNILITGASGLIGGRLSRHLSNKKNLKVTRGSRKNSLFTKIDWQSKKNLEKICDKKNIIINCAGLDVHGSKNITRANLVNAEFPYRLYNAANKKKVALFIFISTYHVYDSLKQKLINEKTKTKNKDIYTSSKLLGEKKLILYKNKTTKLIIIRPCNLFGYPIYKNKNCWNLIINSMIKEILTNGKYLIHSPVNTIRYYSSIESFCIFIENLIKKSRDIEFSKKIIIINFLSNKSMNLVNLTKNILNHLNRKKKKIVKFKYKKLKKDSLINFRSIYTNKFFSNKDKYFSDEIKKTISYVKKNLT
jgi:nucleoside-diphosphate-sugar epimerase